MDEHEYAIVWLAVHLRALDLKAAEKDAAEMKGLALKLWSQEFSEQDTIQLQGERIYPVTPSELDAQLAKLSTAGLEERSLVERLDGLRSVAQGDAAVVIGPSVSDQFVGLEELARLDGGRRIFLDRGADTARKMLEVGVAEARYYGGLEEAGVFQRMVTGAVSVSRHAPTEGPFLTQVGEMLRLAGVPEPIIQAGLEELARDLEAVAEAA